MVDDRAVAPEMLGDVERLVGGAQGGVGSTHDVRKERDPERDREQQRLVSEGLLHGAASALGEQVGLVAVRARHEQGELLAADAGHHVDPPALLSEHPREGEQGAIAEPVAEAIVESLEAVEIADQERERHAVAARALELGGEVLVKAAPVEETGERVGASRLAEVGDGLREPAHEPLDATTKKADEDPGDRDGSDRDEPALDRVGRRHRGQHDRVDGTGQRNLPRGGAWRQEIGGVQSDPHVEQRVDARALRGGVDSDAEEGGRGAERRRQRPGRQSGSPQRECQADERTDRDDEVDERLILGSGLGQEHRDGREQRAGEVEQAEEPRHHPRRGDRIASVPFGQQAPFQGMNPPLHFRCIGRARGAL